MTSTFHGLEVAKRALHTQQSALFTTGHNIANANTEGYTRQRVNFNQTSPFPPASRNRPQMAGQLGTGVEAGSIQRVRDSFVDKQYRQENTSVGYYQTRADMLQKMETILNEPTDVGLLKSMDMFWQSLQDLSVNPEHTSTRAVVKERAIALADSFNYLHKTLQDVRTNLRDEIGVGNTKVNSLIDQINALNSQIGKIEPHGLVPNDLYDRRDSLIDELASYMDIEVTYRDSKGMPSPVAEGIVTITLKTDASNVNNLNQDKVVLVNGADGVDLGSPDAVTHLYTDFDSDNNLRAVLFAKPNQDQTKTTEEYVNELVDNIYDPTSETAFIYGDNYDVNGKLHALIEGAGYLGNGFTYDPTDPLNSSGGTPQGDFNEMLAQLDELVYNFVTEFNAVHQQGYTLEVDADGDGQTDQGGNFFDPNGVTADTIKLSSDIEVNVDLIAASLSGASGDGQNATNLSNVFTKRGEQFLTAATTTLDPKTTIKSFYEALVGQMGVRAQEAMRMEDNSMVLRQQVEEIRQSISSVSLDEEMTNLIKFQHAYNAAARNMTVIDEMLDRIINNMGLVGR